MEPTEKARFDSLYQTHLRALKLRGFSENTIDVYSRAVDGRDAVGRYCDCCQQLLRIQFAS